MFTAALRLIVSAWSRLTEQPRLVPVPVKRQQSAPREGDPKPPAAFCSLPASRRGLTIIEMMVSLASVMMLMMAYVTLFADVGGRIGDARSMIELTNRMRSASNRLRMDLEAHTCDMLPWQRPEAGGGYMEIIEGTLSDKNDGYSATPRFLGDTDDVIMFTVRSKEGSFSGIALVGTPGAGGTYDYRPQQITSEVAEVVWFLRPTLQPNMNGGTKTAFSATGSAPPTFTLYRRVLLVAPRNPDGTPVRITTSDRVYDSSGTQVPTAQRANFMASFPDQSFHLDGSDYVANTLGDLTKRECRFAHDSTTFPHRVDPTLLVPFGHHFNASNQYELNLDSNSGASGFVPTYSRFGQDVILTNVVAFDIQVWDPSAESLVSSGVAVGPSDIAYSGSSTGAMGNFVDLGWDNSLYSASPSAPFRTRGHSDLNSASTLPAKDYLVADLKSSVTSYDQSWLFYRNTDPQYKKPATYDTWSYHYEHDGIDQDGVNGIDQGTNGFDDDTSGPGYGIVDDPGERETSPPYPVPVRGIKIKIRCYEPDARQVHEVNVVESFVPQ